MKNSSKNGKVADCFKANASCAQQTMEQNDGIKTNPNLPQNFLKTQNKKLKSALFKAYFVLFKEFKRLYFGSNFKLKFYEIYDKIAQISRLKIAIKNSAKKLKKWRLKHKERKENFIKARANLKLARKSLKFLKEIAPQSEIWLKSPEFKAKYLDTKHPFPPLLNPANIDYESISAEFAWEMNLPLPRNYQLIWLRIDGSGSAAYQVFFALCKANLANRDDCVDGYMAYLNAYKNLLARPNSYNVIAVNEFMFKVNQKFCALIDKKVPAICNVRDQIERLRVSVNHQEGTNLKPSQRDFDLQSDPKTLFHNVFYFKQSLKPSVKTLKEKYDFKGFCENLNYFQLHFYLRDEIIKHAVKSVEYVNFSQISRENAFDTWTNLALKFGFTPPNENDRVLFEEKVYDGCEFDNFPATLHAKIGSLKEIKLIISVKKRALKGEFTDISEEFKLHTPELIVQISHKDLAFLKANKELENAVKSYLQSYFKEHEIWLKNLRSNLVSVEEILEYFKGEKALALSIYEALNKSLQNLKKAHPEFIKSWSHWAKFEKMCLEFKTEN